MHTRSGAEIVVDGDVVYKLHNGRASCEVPCSSEGWWVGGVAGAVEGAFVFDAVGAVLGSGAFSQWHRQLAIRTRRWAVRQDQRAGRHRKLGEEPRPSGFSGVSAPAG